MASSEINSVSDKTLIIGADGFVGRALCNTLATSGHSIRAVTRQAATVHNSDVEYIVSSMTDKREIATCLNGCARVIYLASKSTPATSAGKPTFELIENLYPLINLLEVLQNYVDIQLLYISSAGSIYKGNHGQVSNEASEIYPRSYHGAGKIAAESFIQAWSHQYKGTATILRPSNVYGPGQLERYGFGIIPTIFSALLGDKTITVWGDGSSERDYLYIDDLIALIQRTFTVERPGCAGTYNVASGIGTSLNELLITAESVTGKRVSREYRDSRVTDADSINIDIKKSSDEFKWHPKTTLEDGLAQTWKSWNTKQA